MIDKIELEDCPPKRRHKRVRTSERKRKNIIRWLKSQGFKEIELK